MSEHSPIKLSELRCNSCGAPLQVPEQANYVTCKHCHAQLAVKRTDSATYTEVLEAFTREAAELRGQVERLSKQNQLTALDQSWERERESHLVYHKDRRPSEPSVVGSVIAGALIGVVGIVMTAVGSQHGGVPVAFGVLAIGIGLVSAIWGIARANQFEVARRRYQLRRQELLRQMDDDDRVA